MCGRFTLRTTVENLAKHFFDVLPIAAWPPITPRHNIAPTQMVVAVRWLPDHPSAEAVSLRWGLIPHWAKDAKAAARLINARGETVAEKPSFRAAFARRRCLIPADGFYEWRTVGKQKIPVHIRREDDLPFCFAGLWERWQSPEGPLESTTIITTEANEVLRPLHDRMPLILEPAEYLLWLRGTDAAPASTSGLQSLITVRNQPPLILI